MQGPYTSGPVMLTSLARAAFYLQKDVGAGRVDGANNDTPQQRQARMSIMQWILAVSSRIETHCRREFLIRPRVQYFDNLNTDQTFFPRAVPIQSVTELATDMMGAFEDPADWSVDPTSYIISQTGGAVQSVAGGLCGGLRTVRLSYLGGLAYHATHSTMTLDDVETPDNITPGLFAYGMTSEAMAKVVSFDEDTGEIVLDSLAGVFIEEEELTFQTTLYGQDIPDTGATIVTIDQQSLCEAHPAIARAVEMELRYMEKHETDHENQVDGSAKGGASRKMPVGKDDMVDIVRPETADALSGYVRYLVGT